MRKCSQGGVSASRLAASAKNPKTSASARASQLLALEHVDPHGGGGGAGAALRRAI